MFTSHWWLEKSTTPMPLTEYRIRLPEQLNELNVELFRDRLFTPNQPPQVKADTVAEGEIKRSATEHRNKRIQLGLDRE
jgi:hypothetical protein